MCILFLVSKICLDFGQNRKSDINFMKNKITSKYQQTIKYNIKRIWNIVSQNQTSKITLELL